MLHRFDLWKYRVDDLLIRRVGLDSDSMEDWLWRDAFDNGMLPVDAVDEFLEYVGFDEGPAEANFSLKGEISPTDSVQDVGQDSAS